MSAFTCLRRQPDPNFQQVLNDISRDIGTLCVDLQVPFDLRVESVLDLIVFESYSRCVAFLSAVLRVFAGDSGLRVSAKSGFAEELEVAFDLVICSAIR